MVSSSRCESAFGHSLTELNLCLRRADRIWASRVGCSLRRGVRSTVRDVHERRNDILGGGHGGDFGLQVRCDHLLGASSQ